MFQSRSAKVIILSSGQALTALVGVVSMAVLTRVFSKADYATYRQTFLAYAFAVPFVTLGLDRALYYFLPSERQRPRGILVENLVLLALAGLLLGAFILCGGNDLLARRLNNPGLATALLLLAPYPLLLLPAASFSGCMMARDRTGQVAAFNVGSRLVMLALVLLPVLIWTCPSAAIIGTVVGAGVTTIAALILMFRACSGGPWQPTASGMAAQVRFAVPLGLASLVGSLSLSLDQVLVSMRCSPETFAVYSVGAMEIPLIGMVTGSITAVVLVDYARYYREGRISEMVELIHRAMVRSAVFLIPSMAFLLCVAPDLMRTLFGQKYEESATPFRVYLLLLPVRAITFGAILQATGRSRHVLVASVLTLAANASIGWLAIGWLGPTGAALASVAAVYFVCVPYQMTIIRSTLDVPVRRMFPWRELVRVTAATVVPSAATLAILMVLPLASIIRLVISGVTFGGLLLAILAMTGLVQLSSMVKIPWALFGTLSRRYRAIGGSPLQAMCERPGQLR